MEYCERVRILISAELDGEITSRERAIILDHLASCQQCREFMNEIERTRGMLRSYLFSKSTDSLDFRLLESLRKARSATTPWWRRSVVVPFPVAAAVVVALLAVLAWVVGISRQPGPPAASEHEQAVVRTVVIQPEDVTPYVPPQL